MNSVTLSNLNRLFTAGKRIKFATKIIRQSAHWVEADYGLSARQPDSMLCSAKVKVSYDNIHLTLGMLHDYFSGVTRYSGPLDKYPSRAFPPLFLPSPLPFLPSPLLFLLLPHPFPQSSPSLLFPTLSFPFPPSPHLTTATGFGKCYSSPSGSGCREPGRQRHFCAIYIPKSCKSVKVLNKSVLGCLSIYGLPGSYMDHI